MLIRKKNTNLKKKRKLKKKNNTNPGFEPSNQRLIGEHTTH